ncbi:MAG TPA: high-potential iron-sulfur protein [Xanthobacteraceae bacterium]|nr:high-potential iron-sulfur protein [Xanthobacteraceae bacterium]
MPRRVIGSKRNFLWLAFAACSGAMLRPLQSRAQSPGKMSKAQAEYQDAPKGIQMCATCSLFEEPRACKVVEGDISPNGWCRSYAMAD